MALKIFGRNKTVEQANTTTAMDRVTSIKGNEWQWGDSDTQYKTLSSADKEAAYKSAPKLFHGINKRARDLVYSGWEIINPKEGEEVPDKIKETVLAFFKERDIDRKIYHAVQEAFWNGTGWIEYVGKGEGNTPLSGTLSDVVYVNTTTMVGEIYNKDKTATEFYLQKVGLSSKKIHVSRLQPIVFYPSGNSSFGIGIPQVAQRVIKADNDATKAMGDNLVMFGHPFPVINTRDNLNAKAVDQGWDVLNKLRKKDLKVGFVGFKDDKFNMLNPVSPNPDAVLNHFYIEYASAIEIPLQLLIGSQMSQLTGNEMELADYYKSTETYQYTILSPIYNKICKLLLGDAWVYDFKWNPNFTDENSENQIKVNIMNAIGDAYNKNGMIELPEARQLLRDNDIKIPADGTLDQEQPEEPPQEPPKEEQPPEMQPQVKTRLPTTEELDIAKKQRELGKRLIKEGAAR